MLTEPPSSAPDILSVSQLNQAVSRMLERSFPLAWVAGEISNFTRAASGHWYFTLKDSGAQVRAVMFRGRAQYADFNPREGDKVEVRALVTLYAPRGDFQLNVEAIRRAGVGNLYEAFLQRKQKLADEGLFDPERKRALPFFPTTIGIVTSPQAAALRDILTTLATGKPPALLIIDSIQTMHSDSLEGAPGTVSQVRASTQELIRYAKTTGTALILVGHVTKDGQLAGPRVLEHMVDTVLYFEGERSHQYRILRAVKNRFGGTDEIGVFAMGADGLEEVANPSSLFLTSRAEGASVTGAVVFPALEGTRPVLCEIQALVVRVPSGATPRRAVVGWDSGRLAMLLAVLEARCGLAFGGHEVYLNVAGGLRIADPAADLAVACALVSALTDRPLPADAVAFGEVALSGELRAAGLASLRLKEAAKLGFGRAFVPDGTTGGGPMLVSGFRTMNSLVDHLGRPE